MADGNKGAGFDEARTRELLAGTEGQIADALALVERHLRGVVCRRLRRLFRGLSAEDVEDAWAETLAALLRAARAKRLGDCGTLLSWLCRVARARATDLSRRRGAREQALVALSHRLRPARGGPAPDSEADDLFGAVLATLPPRQRAVLAAFIDGFPETNDAETLRKEVSRRAGSEESAASVKRALQEARRKAREWVAGRRDSRRAG